MSDRSTSVDELVVDEDGITVTKSFSVDEFPVPAVTFRLVSSRSDSVRVRLTDSIPESLPMDRVGFHPDFESENWTAYNDHRVEFERVLEPDDTVRTVFGIRAEDPDVDAFLTRPTVAHVPEGESISDVLGTDGTDPVREVIGGDRSTLPGMDEMDAGAASADEAPADEAPADGASSDAVAAAAESIGADSDPSDGADTDEGAAINADLDSTIELADPTQSEPRTVDAETTSAVSQREREESTPLPDDADAATPGDTLAEPEGADADTLSLDEEADEGSLEEGGDEVSLDEEADEGSLEEGGDEVSLDEEADELSLDEEADGLSLEENADEVALEEGGDEVPLDEGAVSTSVEEATAARPVGGEESVAAALAAEIRAGRVDDDDLELLRAELDSGTPRSVDVRIERLQSQMGDLAAYVDALEAFIDEDGTATEILENTQSQLDELRDALDDVTDRIERAEHDRQSIADDVVRVESDVDSVETTVDTVHEELGDVWEDLADLDARVTSVEDVADDDVAALEDEIARIDREISELEKFRDRLSDVFGA